MIHLFIAQCRRFSLLAGSLATALPGPRSAAVFAATFLEGRLLEAPRLGFGIAARWLILASAVYALALASLRQSDTGSGRPEDGSQPSA